MKRLISTTALTFFVLVCFAQSSFNWVLSNTGNSPGERVVAIIDAGTIDTYDGIGIVGEVIDCNGNWGFALPTRASFHMFIKFSGGESYKIVQDIRTATIVLRLRKVSDSKFHLTASCPYLHKSAIVTFEKVVGKASLTLGDPNTIDTSGELVISEPVYESVLNGKLGINTGSPDAELAVKGTIHTQEVKVDLVGSVASDFVFEDGYELPELDDTKTFIEANKHLPGVPSAQDMAENGIDLKEMNLMLLQKVEELTLHLIEMKKITDHLMEENTIFKEKITILEK